MKKEVVIIGPIEIIEVTPDNVYEIGNICGRDAAYDTGNRIKARWYCRRYREGLRMKLSRNQEKEITGMIEYVPGEYTWRALDAENYMVIHCLDVFRGHKRKGYGSALLKECIRDSGDKDGIAVVTSSKPWLSDKRFFLENGFKKTETAPPYYELLVRQNKESALPCFHKGGEERALRYGQGITVLYADQCPMIDGALKNLKEAAEECGAAIKFIKLEDAFAARNAPCPSGTFCILMDGKFLTHRIFTKDRYVSLIKNSSVI